MISKEIQINSNVKKAIKVVSKAPERIMMFGEGNFLRAFIGSIIEKMNNSGGYNGSIVALQGVIKGLGDKINAQQGEYTVLERGYQNGEVIENTLLIKCLSRCINPYENYQQYLELAKSSDIEVIISNTTEFGICYEKGAKYENNYPAKLTHWLHERFIHFAGEQAKGVTILPCELIDDNGNKLYETVLKYCSDYNYSQDFTNWLKEDCNFCNTLVDRIVSGYPAFDASSFCEKLGYTDELLDICEPFLLWVIESKKPLPKNFPVNLSGYKIIVTDDMSFYRTRKVRILNGAHTASVLAGYLAGFDTVEQLVTDKVFFSYITKLLSMEVIPLIDNGKMNGYADEVMDRFKNPFLNHRLLSIALNSISKFKTRVLVSIKDYIFKYNKAPEFLSFALAALLEFYKKEINGHVKDEDVYLKNIRQHLLKPSDQYISAMMSDTQLWDEDLLNLSGLFENVNKWFNCLSQNSVYDTIKKLVDSYENN